jgi:hypothetical protein
MLDAVLSNLDARPSLLKFYREHLKKVCLRVPAQARSQNIVDALTLDIGRSITVLLFHLG